MIIYVALKAEKGEGGYIVAVSRDKQKLIDLASGRKEPNEDVWWINRCDYYYIEEHETI